ncbi:MAG: carbon storage regulator, partial [Thermogutta sp.]|uniref:carbon storage regulator n=1 Tax=Thermogutta sp. TaxID=1962930 RepID=UPI0019C4151F
STRHKEARMLILTRKNNERIVIRLADGRHIEVVIARISSRSVKVGVIADRDILILREELQKRRPQCEATSPLNAQQTDAEK